MKIEINFQNLVERCAKQDNVARKELYTLFSPQMFSICLRFAKNESQADDIFQDGFLKVFENIHQVKNTSALPGWIKSIFINTAINACKNELKFQTELIDSVGQNQYTDFDVIKELELKEITELIQKLPVKSRMVFNLYVIEGYSHQEIADLMKISPGTSKSQLFDARQRLKQAIELNAKSYLQIVV